mmetsp:Transcript_94123/g.141021  ORF Transcript_94123/g.141021 Transcript_94123/m.141021 type:complete len:319 (+) Transcript_94123:197-1153(+)
MMLAFRHAQQGLNGHQERTQKDDTSNRKCNIGISLSTLHQNAQSYLPYIRGEKSYCEADRGIFPIQQTKNNERRCRSKASEKNHARRRRRCNSWVDFHSKHQRPLHNATTHSEHASEETRKTTYERVHNCCTTIPFYVSFHVLIANSLLNFESIHQVGTSIARYSHDPNEHGSICSPEQRGAALDSNWRRKRPSTLENVNCKNHNEQTNQDVHVRHRDDFLLFEDLVEFIMDCHLFHSSISRHLAFLKVHIFEQFISRFFLGVYLASLFHPRELAFLGSIGMDPLRSKPDSFSFEHLKCFLESIVGCEGQQHYQHYDQ